MNDAISPATARSLARERAFNHVEKEREKDETPPPSLAVSVIPLSITFLTGFRLDKFHSALQFIPSPTQTKPLRLLHFFRH